MIRKASAAATNDGPNAAVTTTMTAARPGARARPSVAGPGASARSRRRRGDGRDRPGEGRRERRPRADPGDGRRARASAPRRRRSTNSAPASSHAAMAIARAMPGSPSGPTRTTARGVLTTTARIGGDDRRQRVLPGIERPGQDGDEGMRGEPDQERQEVVGGQLDGIDASNSAEQQRDDLGRAGSPRGPRSAASRTASSRRARVTRATNSACAPTAAPRDSDGKSTTPSGTPMTPMGIWSSVKAIVGRHAHRRRGSWRGP